jgi:hypothetical protein
MKRRGAGGGAWADIQNVYRRSLDGLSWVPVWSAYTPLSISGPSTASGHYSCVGTIQTCPTNAVAQAVLDGTIVVSGGSGAISVIWSKVSGTNCVVNSANSANTSFGVPVGRTGVPVTAVYRLSVSDGTSNAAALVNVTGVYDFGNIA